MTLDELEEFEKLRDRLGQSMRECQTDQLRYYTEQIYLDSESLISEIRNLRRYMDEIDEDYYNYQVWKDGSLKVDN